MATTNAGKLAEIARILTGVPVSLLTLRDFGGVPEPDEPGPTFAANARAKALYYGAVTGELTVAEDSGLEIDALGGAPGVESARFGGVQLPYPQKFELIYQWLRERGQDTSAARFICALALVRDGHVVFEADGRIEGRIAPAPQGTGGFGYDPIFYYPPFACTLAEAGDRKSAVSHRGEAFRKLAAFLATTAELSPGGRR
jgi:XTP/dITP diphosphohydrolase